MLEKRNPTIPETAANTEWTTQEYVYERLRHAIMVGAIQPGTDLTMRGLAEAVSYTHLTLPTILLV